MTQNAALSLLGAIVIAIGFLLGWCAGESDPVRAPASAVDGSTAPPAASAAEGRDTRAVAVSQDRRAPPPR